MGDLGAGDSSQTNKESLYGAMRSRSRVSRCLALISTLAKNARATPKEGDRQARSLGAVSDSGAVGREFDGVGKDFCLERSSRTERIIDEKSTANRPEIITREPTDMVR